MTSLQRQLDRADLYETFMFENIRRISLVAIRMKQNVRKCRLSSVLHWKDKADSVLAKKLNGK